MADSVPVEYIPDTLPDVIQADEFSPLNSASAVGLRKSIQYANQLSEEYEPWQIVYCKSRAANMNQTVSAKAAKASVKKCSEFEKTLGFKNLTSAYYHIEYLKNPVPENDREKMLWRIAVRNEEKNPDASIKAVNSMNNMSKGAAGGNTINIQINNEILPRGSLDG